MDALHDLFDDVSSIIKELNSLDVSLETLKGLSKHIKNSDDFQRCLLRLIEDCDPMIKRIAALLDGLCTKNCWLQPQWSFRAREMTNKYRSGLNIYKSTLQIGCDIVSL